MAGPDEHDNTRHVSKGFVGDFAPSDKDACGQSPSGAAGFHLAPLRGTSRTHVWEVISLRGSR